jgi:molybdopterin adenylyltransferase
LTEIPHRDRDFMVINCAIVTVSDTRTLETDKSGQLIEDFLLQAGHQVAIHIVIPDEPTQIERQLIQLCDRSDVSALIFNGGTGIAPRDTTYDAISRLLEIGSRAIASRATAGVYRQKLVFSLPGSSGAVKLAVERLILPELIHLVKLLAP